MPRVYQLAIMCAEKSSSKYRRPRIVKINKAARLAALLVAQDRGLLENYTLQDIADAIGGGIHRSTVMRDLRELEAVRDIYHQITDQLKDL